jgi:hypothetical protein
VPVSAIDVQVRLKNLGFYGGKIDGDLGPASREAIMRALEGLKAPSAPVIEPSVLTPAPVVLTPPTRALLPQAWLQPATVSRVHLHWTAAKHKASENDKDHYHVLVEDDGKVVKGNCDIAANSTTNPRGKRANHTLNANGGALAVSCCAMEGAVERPFSPGHYPLTAKQWEIAAIVTAELCYRYRIRVTPRHVLSHAEVQANLGIQQRGKWDIAILPWNKAYDNARECGDLYRKMVQEHLSRLA